ncbi:acyl-CoA dehydrogenase [Elysia marginata]|uniref:Short-chain specific acyl-CoA dehydrogenase, mitochondrial n=1 Tax=Elysia marginata TaxID=1093978 RepID=A0AAV4F1W4_9GAST|nr:acyl-CoA dehydrogenase [Elysia marginata]
MNEEVLYDIKCSVKDFLERYIKPNVKTWDEAQSFPVEVFRKAGEYGFLGVLTPEKYGGLGADYSVYVAIIEEISKVDPSVGLSIAAHNSLATNHIYLFSEEKQKLRWLPKLNSGQAIGSWGLTEPSSGSDAGAICTTARRDGDNWVINGTKSFITHGYSSDIAVVVCRTGEKNAKNNATAFVVEKGTKGFIAGKKEDKLGMRASETAQQIFKNCIIPDENRLGKVGDGFKQAMRVLEGGRVSIAALSNGISRGAFEAAIKYAKEREQFGKPISTFQSIAFKLADMETQIQASSALIERAINAIVEHSKDIKKLTALAKLFASEACVKIAGEALQIFGGYGYSKEYPVERFYRDSKICTIGEGTSEIQRLIIARDILGE